MTSDSDPYEESLGALRKYKVAWLLLLIGVAGMGLVVLGTGVDGGTFGVPDWVENVPWTEIGQALLSAAVIGAVYEWFIRRESDRSMSLKIGKHLSQQTDAIELMVVSDAYASPDSLLKLSPSVRESALRNAMRAYYGDSAIANELERVVLPQFHSAADAWRDVRYEVVVNADPNPEEWSEDYIEVSLYYEYEGRLKSEVFVAVLKSEEESMFDRIDDPDSLQDFSWTIGRMLKYDWRDPAAAKVESIQIDDQELVLNRLDGTSETKAVVTHGTGEFLRPLVGSRVRHRIELRYKAPKRGHFLAFPLDRTSVGWRCVVRGSLSEVGFRRVFMVPFLQSGGPLDPVVSLREHFFTASAQTSRCVFAGSGAVFVWNLESEYRLDRVERESAV